MDTHPRRLPLLRAITAALFALLAGPLPAEASTISLTYYAEVGCEHCDSFVGITVPRLEKQYGIEIDVDARDILSADIYAECRERLADAGREFRTYPVLFIGNNIYIGRLAVNRGIDAELAYFADHGAFRPRVPVSLDGSQETSRIPMGLSERLPLVPVLVAGLADGINPCAIATIIFLMSLLAVAGRTRCQILTIGLVYAATVFTTYFALGFGLLAAVRSAMNFTALRIVLRVLVSVSAGTFAVLSIRDALLIRSGRSSDATLQLSLRRKRRIHEIMRHGIRTGGLVAGTIGLAFLVALVELACTGQLYLPTIAYLVQTDDAAAAEVFALLGYNVAFIVPLVVVVAVVATGVSSRSIGTWFARRAVAAKIVMGLVFLLLAIAIWLV